MGDLIDDYLRQVAARLPVDARRKSEVTAELATHLRDRVADVRRAEPDLPEDEAARRVLREFGSPEDLALAYDQGEAVLRKGSTGEVVLRVGRAVGRGTRVVLKWTAITLAFLLVLGSALGVWAYYEFQPSIERNVELDVYHYGQDCTADACSQDTVTEHFYVHPDAQAVLFGYGVTNTGVASFGDVAAGGSVTIHVEDPDGNVKLDRTFEAGDHVAWEDHGWGPVTGDWTVTYTYTFFEGRVDVDASVWGLPKGTIGRAR